MASFNGSSQIQVKSKNKVTKVQDKKTYNQKTKSEYADIFKEFSLILKTNNEGEETKSCGSLFQTLIILFLKKFDLIGVFN